MGVEQWEGLEVRHLRALQSVARTGAIGRAALELGYTQSAISQQLAALERTVGARLFERGSGHRSGSLTIPGELLLAHAEEVLGRLEAARSDLEALKSESQARLRVGGYPSVGARVLPELLRAFPALQFHESAIDQEMWAMVEDGALDLAFTALPLAEGSPLEATELDREPCLLVVDARTPLAAPPATVEELYRLPLIVYRSCRIEQRVEAQLRARGIEPNVVFRSDDNGTVQGLAAAGVGVAIMPLLAIDVRDPAVSAIELGDAFPPRTLGLVRHPHRRPTPIIEAFTAAARETHAAIVAEAMSSYARSATAASSRSASASSL